MDAFVKKATTMFFSIKSWKVSGFVTIASFAIFALLGSILFALIVFLLKVALFIAAVTMAVRTLWLLYPTMIKKYEETTK